MLKITAKIDGMMCGMCESHINDIIRKKFNIKKVSSSHTKGTSVIISEEDISDDLLAKELENLGYKLLGVTREDYVKKGFFSRFKK